jgi:hypothetical protein
VNFLAKKGLDKSKTFLYTWRQQGKALKNSRLARKELLMKNHYTVSVLNPVVGEIYSLKVYASSGYNALVVAMHTFWRHGRIPNKDISNYRVSVERA